MKLFILIAFALTEQQVFGIHRRLQTASYPVTATGQTGCYTYDSYTDTVQTAANCDGMYQDASFQSKYLDQDFCDHGDGTVTDMVRKRKLIMIDRLID